ncbi:MAG: ABC transporter permease subunit [Myxococcales bacterium]|nr:ABC transporter permease subunit [Myxococcales bacterium]
MKAPWRMAPLALVTAACLLAKGHGSPTRLEPAHAWCAPSASRLLGCGEGGVNLLPFVAHGILRGVVLAAGVAALAFVIGTVVGAAAALRGGSVERATERTRSAASLPGFLLAMVVLSAVRAPSRAHLGAVFLLTAWAPFARLALSQTRVLREATFVSAAVALGAAPGHVLLRHIVPNLVGVGRVQLGATAAGVVVGEAALAFVGLGPADGVSLGALMDQGVAGMLRAPHVLALGSLSVLVTSGALLVASGSATPIRSDR